MPQSTKVQFQNIKISQNYELSNKAANMLYFDNVCMKATVIGFIWGDREYPAVRFEYKMASEEKYLVAEL